jgi:hypothetical protein
MAAVLSATLLLEAWETASTQQPVRRPLTVLSLLTSRDRRDLEHLTVGQRDAQLLRLRAALFGQQIVAVSTCASCGADAELSFLVRDICVPTKTLDEVSVTVGKQVLTARPLTAGDLEAASAASDVRAELLRRSVGGELDGNSEAIVELGKALAEADPLAKIELDLVCPSCQASSALRFDPWAFLWQELTAWSLRTLGQVHRLARAYGWSESEVLALSPQRRNIYLKMVGA